MNPWLGVPLADYEGHMSSADVRQLTALSDLFAEVLRKCRPESVIVLGVAGGNGLEHIDPTITHRIVGVDIHQEYLDVMRRRFPAAESICADLSTAQVPIEPATLVHAALIFEHAGTDRCLETALLLVAPGGYLSVVLQLPSETQPGVSSTAFASIAGLRDHFRLVDPEHLCSTLSSAGLALLSQSSTPLAGGKAFWLGLFRR